MAEENAKAVANSETSNDHVLTMLDVLQEEEELENDANAVLGGSDERNCSYSQGYVKRQALYACVTCTSASSSVPAGVCLACSIHCHKNHELIELYTKRNFRCDCGNSKFPTTPCTLCPDKDSLNEKNLYNHNFRGTYCTCAKPYPDPEDEIPDSMVQCVVCEDWFHGRHLDNSLPANLDYEEVICGQCMRDKEFLNAYRQTADSTAPVDVETTTEPPKEPGCRLQALQSKSAEKKEGPVFWSEGWRKKLCTCPSCLALYQQRGCEYLVDQEDTVRAYEERGKAQSDGPTSQYDAGMNALQQLNRTEQIEAIHGYNDMVSELKEYLRKFATNNKVVREEDIKEFFTQMTARKRQRVLLPHYCR